MFENLLDGYFNRCYWQIRKFATTRAEYAEYASTKNQIYFRFHFLLRQTYHNWKRKQSWNKRHHELRKTYNCRKFRESKYRHKKKQKRDKNEFCEKTIDVDNSKINHSRIFFEIKFNFKSKQINTKTKNWIFKTTN